MQNNQIDLSGFEHSVIDGWMRDLNTAAYLLVDTPAGEEERLVVMGNDINNGAYQDFAVLPGYTYELKYKLAFGSSGTMNLKVNEGAATIASDSKTTNGSYTLNFTPTASTVRVHYAGNVKFMLNYIQLEYSHTDTIVTVSSPMAGYRYGFNGMEKDDEAKGNGNSYDFGARIYDSRLGRWLTRDPHEAKYLDISPYASMANMPIIAMDANGKDVIIIIYNTEDSRYKQAAWTRAREVKGASWFDVTKDKVIMMGVRDLGKLESMVQYQLSERVRNKYGKTREFSYYGHNGIEDGPRGEENTSGVNALNRQLTLKGWANIDFNFKEGGAIANFYGCNSYKFAQKFALAQDATYTSGYTGGAGLSTSPTEFNSAWINYDYMYMWDDVGLSVYKSKSPGFHKVYGESGQMDDVEWIENDLFSSDYMQFYFEDAKPKEISEGVYSTNLWVDSQGNLHGYKKK